MVITVSHHSALLYHLILGLSASLGLCPGSTSVYYTTLRQADCLVLMNRYPSSKTPSY